MPDFRLPYPGYSWSLSQHTGPGTVPSILYELLQAAYIYGDEDSAGELITDYIVDSNILPPNVRADAGRPQVWRDYQQVLSEFGLIISTRITRPRVIITPIGLMWLDGLIGYSELITTQALRYQYPNGHKDTIQHSLRTALEGQGVAVPASRTVLDEFAGVLIKPAVLILRVLLELLERGLSASLTSRECTFALMPVRTNYNWGLAFENLTEIRRTSEIPTLDIRAHRHVQEWFRLLSRSDIFEVTLGTRSAVRLSAIAMENLEALRYLCDYHEHPSNFWIPQGDRDDVSLSWYLYYGSPNISSQWVAPEEELTSQEYVEENYPEGVDVDESSFSSTIATNRGVEISLSPFSPRDTSKPPRHDFEIDTARQLEGRERQQRSARLHERIVALVAEKLQHNGYEVFEDRDSVDVLATTSENELIVEVKTVTRRNIDNRMRLGVGQLSEYRYRREYQTGNRPRGILVLNDASSFGDWLIDYFQTDIHLGLISLVEANQFQAFTTGNLENMIILP